MQIRLKVKTYKQFVVVIQSHDLKEYRPLLQYICDHNKKRQSKNRVAGFNQWIENNGGHNNER